MFSHSSEYEDFTATDTTPSRSRGSSITVSVDPMEREEKKKASWLFSGCLLLAIFVFLALLSAGGYFLFYERQMLRDQADRIFQVAQHVNVSLYSGEKRTLWEMMLLPLETFSAYVAGEKQKNSFSYSPGYLRAALRLQEAMNLEADPCEDFYEYSCGRFDDNNPIPQGLRSIDFFQKVNSDNVIKIKKLMESTAPETSKAIEKLRLFYRSCLHPTHFEESAVQRTLQLHAALGHYPLLQGDHPDGYRNFSLQDFLVKVTRKGLSPALFDFYPAWHLKNSTRRIVVFHGANQDIWDFLTDDDWILEEPRLPKERNGNPSGLRDKNSTDPHVFEVKTVVEFFAKEAGFPANPNLEQDIEEMLIFVDRLKFIRKEKVNKTTLKKCFTIDTLAEVICMEMFEDIVSRFKQTTGVDLQVLAAIRADIPEAAAFFQDTNLEVRVPHPDFVDRLAELIRKTPPKTIMNYVHYSEVFSHLFSNFLPRRLFELLPKMKGTKQEEQKRMPEWDKCLVEAAKHTSAFGANFVRKYFNQKAKETAKAMVADLKAAFEEILNETEWMDEESRQLAIQKSREMVVWIGANENAYDDAQLDAEYADWNIADEMNFIDMVRESRVYLNRQKWRDYDRTMVRELTTPVNARYQPSRNAIIFFAGILQPPFFDGEYPKALNYGGIGSVIGHEITHGFDNRGKNFDHKGNFREWLTNETKRNFYEESQCMVDQYDGIVLENTDGMKVNGRRTLAENIADNGGLGQSFRAYQKYLEKNGPEKKVPGFDLTNEQLFFVGYAQFWCKEARKEHLQETLIWDKHSPARLRAIVPPSNQPEFSKAFNCRKRSPMNPEKKCNVW